MKKQEYMQLKPVVRTELNTENEEGMMSSLVKNTFNQNKHKRIHAFSSGEPIVQQPAGQLLWGYNEVTVSGIKCPFFSDDLKGSLPTIEELQIS